MAINNNSNYSLTGAQTKDLANKIKSKATITITDTDPGEGAPLAAGEYIAVYGQPALFPLKASSVDWVSMRPTNYASQVTLSGCSYNNNSQQILLYPDGTVILNIAMNMSQSVSAGSTVTLITLPSALRSSSAKNLIFSANCNSTPAAARAYIVGADGRLNFVPGAAISSGAEINISGAYNIYG